MDARETDEFMRYASLLFVLEGRISSKKANWRLRQAVMGKRDGRKKNRLDANSR